MPDGSPYCGLCRLCAGVARPRAGQFGPARILRRVGAGHCLKLPYHCLKLLVGHRKLSQRSLQLSVQPVVLLLDALMDEALFNRQRQQAEVAVIACGQEVQRTAANGLNRDRGITPHQNHRQLRTDAADVRQRIQPCAGHSGRSQLSADPQAQRMHFNHIRELEHFRETTIGISILIAVSNHLREIGMIDLHELFTRMIPHRQTADLNDGVLVGDRRASIDQPDLIRPARFQLRQASDHQHRGLLTWVGDQLTMSMRLHIGACQRDRDHIRWVVLRQVRYDLLE
jgi:hypothetical protein